MKEILIKLLTSEYVLTGIGSAVAAIWLYFARKQGVDQKSKDREALVQKAAEFAYQIVNDIAKTTSTPVDDKIAVGLEKFIAYLKTHGAEPTPVEVERARLVFQAFHGEGR